MVGNTQAQTTARYAHLYDDSLREAAEKLGDVVTLQGQENKALSYRSVQ